MNQSSSRNQQPGVTADKKRTASTGHGSTDNVDAHERDQFAVLASTWWDTEGPMRPLHDLNPARLEYVMSNAVLPGQAVLDVGCGGGILAESMARQGAQVDAIDIADDLLDVARLHALETAIKVDYRHATVEQFAATAPAGMAVVTCMEMLEHVPDPQAVVAACAAIVRPGGKLFFSTLNRHPLAFALGIVAAEYVLGLLPRGTHRYERFIKPSELAGWCRQAGLQVCDISALHYNPLTRHASVGGRPLINYVLHAVKPGSITDGVH
ncbi:MAG: bifunctional 2-polyprenyl-6-hydroxyphenol methylase/3-demethylubiquinol 3-O-methyltransferase UbiG [Gammaproteobacteria bacterium]|jgi:2-polyprenyl-6-hydroxyphenyl methylase/3-demethylubiquinone-9 3-methyltransferase|nr:bifunctional 2-polyprenyl-6-hydroxyphenol methylase/3-demethylubiquinol 3-O-methyltransferase UbiG [Gammaproteobacteria bacterium]